MGGRAAAAILAVLVLAAAGADMPGSPAGPDRGSPAVVKATPGPGSVAASGAGAGDHASVAGRIAVSPITIRLERVERRRGSKASASVRATVTNLGAARLGRIELTLASTPSPSPLVVRPATPQVIRRLGPGGTAGVTWSLCSRAGGAFVLVATARLEGAAVRSAPLAIVVVPASRC